MVGFIEQIKSVKESVERWRESWGDSFQYLISPFYSENEETGETTLLISKQRHREILKYLDSVGYLSVGVFKGDKVKLSILPVQKQIIRPKSLELIAKRIGESWSAREIIAQLKECGIDERLIVYPNTKWRMVNDIFKELSSSTNKKHHQLLFRVISNAVHPLNHDGNTILSGIMLHSFNEYLGYDNYIILYNKGNGDYYVTKKSTETDADEEAAFHEHLGETEDKAIQIIKENHLDDLVLMKKAYQLLMGIVDTYLEKQDPTEEFNSYYLQVVKLLNNKGSRIFDSLKKAKCQIVIGTVLPAIPHYSTGDGVYKPFRSLYSASEELRTMSSDGGNSIKARMRSYFGEIIELCLICEAGDVVEEVDAQELLNEISLYLSNKKSGVRKKSSVDLSKNIANWPEDFGWDSDDNNKYRLGKEFVTFDGESDRKSIFSMIVGAEGDDVRVKDISNKLNTSDANVRTVIYQINKKKLVKKPISLESTKKGSYYALPL